MKGSCDVSNTWKQRSLVLLGFIVSIGQQLITVSADGPQCMQSGSGPKDMVMADGSMNPKYMWYKVGHKTQVPVVIDKSYSYKELRTVLRGLMEIESKSCVEFYIFHGNHTLHGYDYVYITRQKKGCWSYVGRVGRGLQEVSLPPGCINHRTAVHEMMHALGFSHEHVRSDRDDYVLIYWGNIKPGREKNFRKRSQKKEYYGPYDYKSIMHYQRTAFSKNGRHTIHPLKHGARIGVFKHMSYWDSEKLRRMYKCPKGGGGGGHYYSPVHSNSISHDGAALSEGLDLGPDSFSTISDYLNHDYHEYPGSDDIDVIDHSPPRNVASGPSQNAFSPSYTPSSGRGRQQRNNNGYYNAPDTTHFGYSPAPSFPDIFGDLNLVGGRSRSHNAPTQSSNIYGATRHAEFAPPTGRSGLPSTTSHNHFFGSPYDNTPSFNFDFSF